MEKIFRSGWFWLGLLIGCYLLSSLWLGSVIFFSPLIFMVAPSGIFHLLGFSAFENGIGVVDSVMMFPAHLLTTLMLLFIHLVFWVALIFLISHRKGMPRIPILRLSWGLIIFIAMNFVGCATMSYHL